LLDYCRDGELSQPEIKLVKFQAEYFGVPLPSNEKSSTTSTPTTPSSNPVPTDPVLAAITQHAADLMEIYSEIPKRQKLLEDRAKAWKEMCARVSDLMKKSQNRISLDVGGKIFHTTKETLTSIKGSYFDMLLNGKWNPDKNGINILFL
jgi:hypothetical protein